MNLKDAIKQAGSGARGAKFDVVGQVQGGVVESAEIFQSRDEDGELEVWDDGAKKNKLRIIVQTNLNEGKDDEGREDDGRRALYLKWWGDQRKEFLSAMEKAGLDDLTPGCKFYGKWVGEGPRAKKAWSKPKLMKYKAVPAPNVPAGVFDEDEQEKSPAKSTVAVKKTTARRKAEPESAEEAASQLDDFGDDAAVESAPQPAAEDNLDDTSFPVDDTAGALAAAGLGPDF